MNLLVLSALAEPNRLAMVELLRGGSLPVNHIARRLKLPQPQVSKHLKVLRMAKIVAVKPHNQQRYYYLRPQVFGQLEGWAKFLRSSSQKTDPI